VNANEFFEVTVFAFLAFMLIEIAILDPVLQVVKYQVYRYGRLAWLRAVLSIITVDTRKWETDDPMVPSPTAGVVFLLVIVFISSLFSGSFQAALVLGATLALIFAGMHYRELNETFER
jgi:hypothetical protein